LTTRWERTPLARCSLVEMIASVSSSRLKAQELALSGMAGEPLRVVDERREGARALDRRGGCGDRSRALSDRFCGPRRRWIVRRPRQPAPRCRSSRGRRGTARASAARPRRRLAGFEAAPVRALSGEAALRRSGRPALRRTVRLAAGWSVGGFGAGRRRTRNEVRGVTLGCRDRAGGGHVVLDLDHYISGSH
jgi:hypothetical protein